MKYNRGNIIPATLAASAIMGLITSVSLFITEQNTTPATEHFSLTPSAAVVTTENTVTFDLVVFSDVAVNAFGGTLVFDEKILTVEKIDYNTSIADLWAKAPWYEKGAGTISFGGGTTKPGGFIGTGKLLTVTFKARKPGETRLHMRDVQVLEHDGYGTILTPDSEIDRLLVVAPKSAPHKESSVIIVRSNKHQGDLNGDGIVSLKDASIMFGYIAIGDARGDIDRDNRTTLTDMSILMSEL
jgi:hypothetical protein